MYYDLVSDPRIVAAVEAGARTLAEIATAVGLHGSPLALSGQMQRLVNGCALDAAECPDGERRYTIYTWPDNPAA